MIFIMCSYFCKNLPVVMYRKFRNAPIFKDIPPICPYFLGFRVGKYDTICLHTKISINNQNMEGRGRVMGGGHHVFLSNFKGFKADLKQIVITCNTNQNLFLKFIVQYTNHCIQNLHTRIHTCMAPYYNSPIQVIKRSSLAGLEYILYTCSKFNSNPCGMNSAKKFIKCTSNCYVPSKE